MSKQKNIFLNNAIILFLNYFLILINGEAYNTGTVLFHKADATKKCWTKSERDLLLARRAMQDYLPDPDLIDFADEDAIPMLLEYFRTSFNVVKEGSSGETQQHLIRALADATAGYLRAVVLPVTRAAYYAGSIGYNESHLMVSLYDDLKVFLKAPSGSWKPPISGLFHTQFSVTPLEVSTSADEAACDHLLTQEPQHVSRESKKSVRLTRARLRRPDVEDSQPELDEPPLSPDELSHEIQPTVIIPLPMLDSSEEPRALALPWKDAPLFSLLSPDSADILPKYYVTSIKCIKERSTSTADITHFNTQLYSWLNEEVLPHLQDEKWYIGFGGVLRVLESIKLDGLEEGQIKKEENKEDGHYIFGGNGVEINNRPQPHEWPFGGPMESWPSRSHHFVKEAFGVLGRYSGNTKSHVVLLITFLLLVLSVGLLCCCCTWWRKRPVQAVTSMSKSLISAVKKMNSQVSSNSGQGQDQPRPGPSTPILQSHRKSDLSERSMMLPKGSSSYSFKSTNLNAVPTGLHSDKFKVNQDDVTQKILVVPSGDGWREQPCAEIYSPVLECVPCKRRPIEEKLSRTSSSFIPKASDYSSDTGSASPTSSLSP